MSARRRRPAAHGRRWGLVLGGGGVLGGAWLVGALSALEEVTGRDARDADVVVGTSVGSFAAAILGSGASVDDWRAHQLGHEVEHGPMAGLAWNYDADSGGATPPTPGRRPGSPRILTGKAGTKVTVLGPGPEDLAVMGGNLMDPRRRVRVLETSMRTSLAALADPEPLHLDGAS